MLPYSRNDIYKITDLSFLIILIILIIFCDFLKIFDDFLDQREKIYQSKTYCFSFKNLGNVAKEDSHEIEC